jgi:hypothetical protein
VELLTRGEEEAVSRKEDQVGHVRAEPEEDVSKAAEASARHKMRFSEAKG